ncbi:spermatogenesis-defective protein 39 homolog isoform X1 [Lates japonicus]|uniref:Spermatogenesis-defective protein 39 homolog isoform X1 n=1 Tax=Lates japonicus TaxID=270547 RepID=A0AAD3NJ19_LATJO|nr:spermatogenesis-defective protein 39 homolog isoform X1 [Lates japonicus]
MLLLKESQYVNSIRPLVRKMMARRREGQLERRTCREVVMGGTPDRMLARLLQAITLLCPRYLLVGQRDGKAQSEDLDREPALPRSTPHTPTISRATQVTSLSPCSKSLGRTEDAMHVITLLTHSAVCRYHYRTSDVISFPSMSFHFLQRTRPCLVTTTPCWRDIIIEGTYSSPLNVIRPFRPSDFREAVLVTALQARAKLKAWWTLTPVHQQELARFTRKKSPLASIGVADILQKTPPTQVRRLELDWEVAADRAANRCVGVDDRCCRSTWGCGRRACGSFATQKHKCHDIIINTTGPEGPQQLLDTEEGGARVVWRRGRSTKRLTTRKYLIKYHHHHRHVT